MVSPVCDSGTGSLLCYGFGTGMWQWYKSTPVADIAVNRHQSSISSLESYRTSKYPQLSESGLEALQRVFFCSAAEEAFGVGSRAFL